MRYVRYRTSDEETGVGVLHDGVVYQLHDLPRHEDPMAAALGLAGEAASVAFDDALASGPVTDARILSPLNPGARVLAMAQNYRGPSAPRVTDAANPWFFCKLPPIAGPGDPITLWDIASVVVNEIELAIVIGTGGRNIPVEVAGRHIGGYTIFNDVSARGLVLPSERRDAKLDEFFDWLHGKWLDGFGIAGPAIVTPDEVGDIRGRSVETWVSGELRVAGTTSDMVFDAATTVAFASRLMTLRPGDVIATGTPHPTGAEVPLRPGDLVTGAIEGVGSLVNPVVADSYTKGSR